MTNYAGPRVGASALKREMDEPEDGSTLQMRRMSGASRRGQAAEMRGASDLLDGGDQAPATAKAVQAAPADDAVTIQSGQLTTFGEGDDALTGHIHWPGTAASGVTLGKGYDIGSRSKTEVITDLTTAGMGQSQAERIAEGCGLKGNAARDFVRQNRESVGEIARDVQYALLAGQLDRFREKARDTATNTTADRDNRNAAGRERKEGVAAGTYVMTIEQWDGLHPAMVEFLTDLIYQGGYYGYDRVAKVNTALKTNHGDHLAQFKAVLALFESGYMDTYAGAIGEGKSAAGSQSEWFGQTVDYGGRYRRNAIRRAYLKNVIAALESGKTVNMSRGGQQQQQPENNNDAVTPPPLPEGGAAGGATTPEVPVPVPAPRATYVVQRGEGLNRIAQKLGVTVDAIVEANRDKLKTWGKVQGFNAGETIVVPQGGSTTGGQTGAGGQTGGQTGTGGQVDTGATTGSGPEQGPGTGAAGPEVGVTPEGGATDQAQTPEGPATPRVDPSVEIEASVGAGGKNVARDVVIVQSHLVRLGYLSADAAEVTAARGEAAEAVVSNLRETIEAIRQYQRFGLGAGGDGRVDAGGNTWKQMTGRIQMINEYGSHVIETQPIDPVLSTNQWISQFPSDPAKNGDGRGLKESEKAYAGKRNAVCCWDAAQAMTLQAGGTISHVTTSRIPTLLQQDGESKVLGEQASLGVKYIDKQLQEGRPVMIGVDDGRVAAYNADATTEHFIVIVGKVVDGGEVYYRFFDPGTSWGSKGYSATNLLHLGADSSLSGKSYSGSKTYTMAQVRQNG